MNIGKMREADYRNYNDGLDDVLRPRADVVCVVCRMPGAVPGMGGIERGTELAACYPCHEKNLSWEEFEQGKKETLRVLWTIEKLFKLLGDGR